MKNGFIFCWLFCVFAFCFFVAGKTLCLLLIYVISVNIFCFLIQRSKKSKRKRWKRKKKKREKRLFIRAKDLIFKYRRKEKLKGKFS